MREEKKLEFDEGQRAAIGADRNVVVSAGAGSGKTTVLAERYVRLVTERELDVDSVLTLTFTRKAAAEMYARIYKRLSKSTHPRAKEQLAKFDKARIMTLDAFCAAIARGACHRYGVPPDFSVDEARLARVADETAVEILMDRRNDPVVRRLVATRGFDSIRIDFLVDLALRAISLTRKTSFVDDARRQIDFVDLRVMEFRRALEDQCASILGIDEEGGKTLASAQDAVRKVVPLPSGTDVESTLALSRACSYLASGSSYSTPQARWKQPGVVILREITLELKPLASELALLCETSLLRQDVLAVGAILDDFSARFLERKRREGLLSFHDAADLAVDILKTDVELRSHYKNRIRAIMIDEFQDDNELQKELLYLLSERADRFSRDIPTSQDLSSDKLFFVGDEKQSIYRFRGADVSVFRRLSSELAGHGDSSLSLSVNYRSSGELVDFFNAFFPGVFGSAEREFEAAFSRIGGAPAKVEEPSAPAVEFHALPRSVEGDEDADGTELSAAAAEAFAAAIRVAEGIRSGEFDPGDVAILFRSTSRQHEYERALRLLGLPFVAADPRGVFQEGPANDLYALLRLVLFPNDRNAYAAVLRSPFVRLGDDALARVLLDQRRDPFPEEAPQGWFASQDDARRFAIGRDLYSTARARADREGVAALLSRLWYDSGYRSSILASEAESTCLGHFDLLYELALDADRRRLNLGAFLDELAPFMGTSDKIESGDPPEGANAIKLMTVHKSKGLEFPVVLIADAGNEGRGLRDSRPYYLDPDYGPVVTFRQEDAARNETTRNYFFERVRKEEEARDLAELRRLLYVAATRAERKLFIFGSRKISRQEREELSSFPEANRVDMLLRSPRVSRDGSIRLKSFLDLVSIGLASATEEFPRCSIVEIPTITEKDRRGAVRKFGTSTGSSGNSKERKARTMEAFFNLPLLRHRTELRRSTTPSVMEKVARISSSSKSGAKPEGDYLPSLPIDELLQDAGLEAAFGTLCHYYIERILNELPLDAQGEAARALQDAKLDESQRAQLDANAISLARAFQDSPLGREAVASPRRRAEFPFLLALPSRSARPYLVNGKMDLIYESADRCVIVDFKTDRRLDPGSHTVQLAAYRAAASAFSDLPAETWLFYLRGSRAVLVDEPIDTSKLGELASIAANSDERNL